MSSCSRGFVAAALCAVLGLTALPPMRGQDANARSLPKRIVADYVYWSKPGYSHTEIPYYQLTHINHAGISFNADSSLSIPSGFLEPGLNHRAHLAGVKVMVLLGGDFSGLEVSG